MEKIIGICGISCTDCSAFKATQENDDSKRRQVAEEWSKTYHSEIRPDQIKCNGCLPDLGIHQQLHVCEIRKCGIQRKAKNCAHCVDYKCERLSKFLENVPDAEKILEETHKHVQE